MSKPLKCLMESVIQESFNKYSVTILHTPVGASHSLLSLEAKDAIKHDPYEVEARVDSTGKIHRCYICETFDASENIKSKFSSLKRNELKLSWRSHSDSTRSLEDGIRYGFSNLIDYRKYVNDISVALDIKRDDKLSKLFTILAQAYGKPVSHRELADSSGYTQAEIEKYLPRLLEFGYIIKLTKFEANSDPIYYFLDSGLYSHAIEDTSIKDNHFKTWCISEIYKHYINQGLMPEFYYADNVDLIIKDNEVYYPINIAVSTPNKPHIKSEQYKPSEGLTVELNKQPLEHIYAILSGTVGIEPHITAMNDEEIKAIIGAPFELPAIATRDIEQAILRSIEKHRITVIIAPVNAGKRKLLGKLAKQINDVKFINLEYDYEDVISEIENNNDKYCIASYDPYIVRLLNNYNIIHMSWLSHKEITSVSGTNEVRHCVYKGYIPMLNDEKYQEQRLGHSLRIGDYIRLFLSKTWQISPPSQKNLMNALELIVLEKGKPSPEYLKFLLMYGLVIMVSDIANKAEPKYYIADSGFYYNLLKMANRTDDNIPMNDMMFKTWFIGEYYKLCLNKTGERPQLYYDSDNKADLVLMHGDELCYVHISLTDDESASENSIVVTLSDDPFEKIYDLCPYIAPTVSDSVTPELIDNIAELGNEALVSKDMPNDKPLPVSLPLIAEKSIAPRGLNVRLFSHTKNFDLSPQALKKRKTELERVDAENLGNPSKVQPNELIDIFSQYPLSQKLVVPWSAGAGKSTAVKHVILDRYKHVPCIYCCYTKKECDEMAYDLIALGGQEISHDMVIWHSDVDYGTIGDIQNNIYHIESKKIILITHQKLLLEPVILNLFAKRPIFFIDEKPEFIKEIERKPYEYRRLIELFGVKKYIGTDSETHTKEIGLIVQNKLNSYYQFKDKFIRRTLENLSFDEKCDCAEISSLLGLHQEVNMKDYQNIMYRTVEELCMYCKNYGNYDAKYYYTLPEFTCKRMVILDGTGNLSLSGSSWDIVDNKYPYHLKCNFSLIKDFKIERAIPAKATVANNSLKALCEIIYDKYVESGNNLLVCMWMDFNGYTFKKEDDSGKKVKVDLPEKCMDELEKQYGKLDNLTIIHYQSALSRHTNELKHHTSVLLLGSFQIPKGVIAAHREHTGSTITVEDHSLAEVVQVIYRSAARLGTKIKLYMTDDWNYRLIGKLFDYTNAELGRTNDSLEVRVRILPVKKKEKVETILSSFPKLAETGYLKITYTEFKQKYPYLTSDDRRDCNRIVNTLQELGLTLDIV